MITQPTSMPMTAARPAPTVREILVPTDLSDVSDAALAPGAVLAESLDARLTLYHALEFPDHEYGHWAFGERPSVWDEEERLAYEHLADSAEGLAVPHRTVVERAASPARALVRRIEATMPDLTVMATRQGELAHLVMGSVAGQVVARCQAPVLCVKGTYPIARSLAGRIVLSTDFSEGARPALRLATLLAGRFGGELVVVHAGGTPRAGRDAEEPWTPYAAAERWLAPIPPGLTVRVIVDPSPPVKAALRVAIEEKAGLVVAPRRPEPSVARGAGETARLVRHAHCSVLVV